MDDLVQDTLREALEALEKAPPRGSETMHAWLSTIAQRVVADFLTKRNRRKPHEGPKPGGAEQDADGGEIDAPKAPAEPSHDPREHGEDERGLDTWFARKWLERQVATHPHERDTLEILLEHEEEGRTYQQIAEARAMTLTALSSRIVEFKKKYGPRYEKWRSRAMLWVFLGGAVVVAVAAILVWLLLRPPPIGPDPSTIPPARTPVPSVTASAPPPFEPAEPPRPPVRDMKPRQ